jgi:hypothetical protein
MTLFILYILEILHAVTVKHCGSMSNDNISIRNDSEARGMLIRRPQDNVSAMHVLE